MSRGLDLLLGLPPAIYSGYSHGTATKGGSQQKSIVTPPGGRGEGIVTKLRKSGQNIIVKYCDFGVAVFPYHTSIHPLAI